MLFNKQLLRRKRLSRKQYAFLKRYIHQAVENQQPHRRLIDIPIPHRGYIKDNDGFVHVYTDGSVMNTLAGCGVYFGYNHPLNASVSVVRPSNVLAVEYEAAMCAIRIAKKDGIKKLRVFSDSKNMIDSMQKWKKNGWKRFNGTQEIVQGLDETIQNSNITIEWIHIPAHSGIPGNEEADKLARLAASA